MPDSLKVQWPAKALDEAGDDLAPALRRLLEELRLLQSAKDEDAGVDLLRTPNSLQVMSGGSTAITKLYSLLAAAVGGGGALLSGILAFWGSFEGSPLDVALQRSAFMGSAAVLGSSVAIAVAVMVRGDVKARADAMAAAYGARASIASTFLTTVDSALPRPPEQARYAVLTADQTWRAVVAFEWRENTVVATTADDRIPFSEWRGLLNLADT